MKSRYLFILGFFLNNPAIAQDLSSTSAIKSKIDSVRNFVYTGPSVDLLPADFTATALENEYYCDRAYLKGLKLKGQVSVLRLRDNHTFIYETFYKPYDWARIQFYIGNYTFSGDTIYLKYRPLLEGKTGQVYISPIIRVSWIPPAPPDYLLLDNGRLFDALEQRPFELLIDKPQFRYDLK